MFSLNTDMVSLNTSLWFALGLNLSCTCCGFGKLIEGANGARDWVALTPHKCSSTLAEERAEVGAEC